jgi:hypothetical protein
LNNNFIYYNKDNNINIKITTGKKKAKRKYTKKGDTKKNVQFGNGIQYPHTQAIIPQPLPKAEPDYNKLASGYLAPIPEPARILICVVLALINNEVIMAVITNFSVMMVLILISISLLILRWRERNDVIAQKKHNYLRGNIKNIPVVLIIVLCIMIYFFYTILRNRFWIYDTNV